MHPKIRNILVLFFSTIAAVSLRAGPPTEADVGDPDSFGHGANFLGAVSGAVFLNSDCSTIDPSFGQCYTLNPAPASTDFDDEDVCHIKLPKGSTHDILYPVVSFFHSYTFQNNTGTEQEAQFFYVASITIDSAALNDPSCIDPNANNGMGAPCNGHLTMQYNDNSYNDQRFHFANGDKTHNTQNYSHVGNLGITKRFLVEKEGIPQNIADKLFAGAMTLHLTIQGSSQMVSSGRITGNMRLFGD
jgi:hypothetical protein